MCRPVDLVYPQTAGDGKIKGSWELVYPCAILVDIYQQVCDFLYYLYLSHSPEMLPQVALVVIGQGVLAQGGDQRYCKNEILHFLEGCASWIGLPHKHM